MIPKTIHYCWFGGKQKPNLAIKCINSWKKYCPNYKIIEWNETNFDTNCNKYCNGMTSAKKWAFLTDYVRLKVIYENGGIYLDTDVELLKPLDELLKLKAFFALEDDTFIATGLGFGAEKNNPIIYKNMRYYEECEDLDSIKTCPIVTSQVFEELGYGFKTTDYIDLPSARVYSSQYFCPMNYHTKECTVTDKTFSIHHYSASWLSKDELKKLKVAQKKSRNKRIIYKIKHLPNIILKKVLGKKLYKKLKIKLKRQI